jgi:threonine dehydrogenase-like Zn-dependent dehydrogenase
MKGTMKAARLYQPGEPMRVEEIPIPEIGPGEVLVRVRRGGLNRGDLHMRKGTIRATPKERGDIFRVLPLTVGHDGLGEVVEAGPGVRGFNAGDKVIARCTLTCGFCKYCRTEREHLCPRHRVMGFVSHYTSDDPFIRYKDGLWAEYCRIPATNVEKLQPGDDVDKFCLVSQMAVGMRALKRTRLEAGETVIVNAATGITGIGVVLSALAMGAGHIIAVARDPERLARFQKIDPKRISIISAKTDSIRERVAELTHGEGASVLIDVNPSSVATTHDCIYSLEAGGRVALLGNTTEPLQIPYVYLMVHSIEFTSCHGRNYKDIHHLIDLVRAGLIDVSHVRPKFFKLDQVNEALECIDKREPGELAVWPMWRAD